MAAAERLLPRFRAAHTQVLGVSVDSVYCHANWASGLGGISFPLLADFHPKGQVARSYGVYLQDAGIADRATVIIDAAGIVHHASSVTPAGERRIKELADLCEQVDRGFKGQLADFPEPPGLEGPAELFIKSNCGFSRAVLLARDNLHLADALSVRNMSEDEQARATLERLAGKIQAPCLVQQGRPLFESADIIHHLVASATDLPG